MNAKVQILRLLILTAAVTAVFSSSAFAAGSGWCGMNGLYRFSFAEGDSLVTVLHTGEPENGMTTFDLYAWLTDLDPVAHDGEAFLRVGMVEFKLSISGAEAFILEQEFPSKALDIGKELGHVVVALDPGEKIIDGKVFLVRWKIMIKGRPENVRFDLDPTWLVSCKPGSICANSEPPGLYFGNMSSRQEGYMFGAGFVPSWLNPTDEPDQTPVTGKLSWRDAGLFQER